MSIRNVEHNELIAVRVPAGDRWKLVDDTQNIIHKTLTDTLEAFLHQTNFKGSYRLDPMDSKLYAIQSHEEEVVVEETKKFGLYGELEFKQGK
jgi:hypothetical protein